MSCLYPTSQLSPAFSFHTRSTISSLLFLATLSSCLQLRPQTRSFLWNVLSLCVWQNIIYLSGLQICPPVCSCCTQDTCTNAPDHMCPKMSCSQLVDFGICVAAVNSVSHKFPEIFIRQFYDKQVGEAKE